MPKHSIYSFCLRIYSSSLYIRIYTYHIIGVIQHVNVIRFIIALLSSGCSKRSCFSSLWFFTYTNVVCFIIIIYVHPSTYRHAHHHRYRIPTWPVYFSNVHCGRGNSRSVSIRFFFLISILFPHAQYYFNNNNIINIIIIYACNKCTLLLCTGR
jgi:hypothetical protein